MKLYSYSIRILFFLVSIVFCHVDPLSGSTNKFLILHDFKTGPTPTPSFIQKNQAYLETLPFNGITVYLMDENSENDISPAVMKDTPLPYETVASVLAPLKDLKFKALTQNFAFVLSPLEKTPDFFDDWSTIIQNFANVARAAREVGLKGIIFDNEDNLGSWNNFPEGCKYYPSKPLKEYQDQVRLRGKQIMEAMVAQFPEIVFLSFHGPYISEDKTPAKIFPLVQVQASNRLLGPFFVGFMEGMGPKSTVVDGGELYDLRTPKQFQEAYIWRKSTIASGDVDCSFIPLQLRTIWANRLSIGFGLYDTNVSADIPMNPSMMSPTVTNALRRADQYVWLYTESASFLKTPAEGGTSENWIRAVMQGRYSWLYNEIISFLKKSKKAPATSQ